MLAGRDGCLGHERAGRQHVVKLLQRAAAELRRLLTDSAAVASQTFLA